MNVLREDYAGLLEKKWKVTARTFFSFPFSVSEGRAVVTEGNDLRGLGICHQQAFTQICPEYVNIKKFHSVDHELKKIPALL